MSIRVTFKDLRKGFNKKLDQKSKKWLISAGTVAVNQAADISRVDKGASKNAKNFTVVGTSTKYFGPPIGDENRSTTKPKIKYSVRVSAPLEYDGYLEKRFDIMFKSLNLIKGSLDKLKGILKI